MIADNLSKGLMMNQIRPVQAHSRGFTLIELLTVIAIIGILIGITLPAVNAVRNSARVNQTRTQFNQYITAMEAFRVEYGYYPTFSFPSEVLTEDFRTAINQPANRAQFFSVSLTGRRLDGTRVTGTGAANDALRNTNPREVRFYQFGDAEIDTSGPAPRIMDAFGNTNIFVVIDTDGNGLIRSDAFSGIDVSEDVRTGVAFYSVPDNSLGFREVRSW